jgi:hypothetical protein
LRGRVRSSPFENIAVDVFSMSDAKDNYLPCGDLENHPIISHPKFPITFESSLQRFPKDFRMFSKTLFNRLLYDSSISGIDGGKIDFLDVRMIVQPIGHAALGNRL